MDKCHSRFKHAVLHVQINRRGLLPIETCNSAPKVALLHAKTTDEGWEPEALATLMLITLFCMHKTIVEAIEISNSDAKVAVLNAQNHRLRLGPTDKCHSGSKHAVLHSQINRRGLGPIETCNSAPKVAVLNAKTTDEGWDP